MEGMAIKALFTYNYGKEKMDRIKELGYDITIISENTVNNNWDTDNSEILVCYNPFESLDVSKMKSLKWIQLSSIGVDQLPFEKLKKIDVVVTNNRGGYSIPMGEWIVMSILQLLKNSMGLYRKQRSKVWKIDTSLLELYNKKVGFIGTGSIAVEAAKRLQGFDVEVIGLNTSGRDVSYFDRCLPMEKIDFMVSLCDVVVVTIPYTEKTHHMFNDKMFSKMKKGVFFINLSRGSIVDEAALIENIRNGRIAGAALDVFESEPLDEKSPLWSFDNVIITPHNSWISEMRNERRFEAIYENMKRYAQGEKLINVIDLNKGY